MAVPRSTDANGRLGVVVVKKYYIIKAMGVIKVIKAVVGRGAEVVEPEAEMTVVNMIASHLANVPRDGTSLLFCLAMSLSLCFVLALAVVHWSSPQESVEEKESEQKDAPEVGELMCKIVDAETEQDGTEDTEDETVSKDDTNSIDDPPTPTMSPSTGTIDEKKADKSSSETPAPSVAVLYPSRRSSRRISLTAKAKSFGGSMRRLKFNKSKKYLLKN